MAILIDQAQWPAHGTWFAHLASDRSLAELDAFAEANRVEWRAFDHDHYDVPTARIESLILAGAEPVTTRELLSRVSVAGLRVRGADRTVRAARARRELSSAWSRLLPQAPELGVELVQRWSEPHRRYHDTRHLYQMLDAIDRLSEGSPEPTVQLAAWFHDAVYDGVPVADETASAALAEHSLAAVGLPSSQVKEVCRLVLATIDHQPDPGDADGSILVDADLSILGQVPGRYQVYLRQVRAEHPELTESDFALARHGVVEALLSAQELFTSSLGRNLWLEQAERNLTSEKAFWLRILHRQPDSDHGGHERGA